MSNWAPQRPEYYVQTGGMHQNPFGVPRDEIIRMLLENPPEVSAQVIFGKYVEDSGLVFTSEVVQMLFEGSGDRVLGNFWMDKEAVERAKMIAPRFAEYGSPYHAGVDYARQTDYTVLTVLDTSVMPARVVYYKRLNRVPWETIYTEVGKVRYLFGPNILCDSTGPGGDVVMDSLDARNFCPQHQKTVMVGSVCMRDGVVLGCDSSKYLALSCCEGFTFSGPTKKELVEHLRNCLGVGFDQAFPDASFGLLRSPSIVQLREELSFYAWDDKRLDTDCLFSLALAAWSGLEEVVGDPALGSVYGT